MTRHSASMDNLRARWRNEARRERGLLRRAVESARDGDGQRLFATVAETPMYMWRRTMLWLARSVARDGPFPDCIHDTALRCWISYGDSMRQEVGDDLVLLDGLKTLLPPYSGPALRLYRGELFPNRCRRTYGIAWTSSREVAESYGLRTIRRSCDGGTVLLASDVPADAILCAVPEHEDRYGEVEYLVDRRRLERVEVLARYSEIAVQVLAGED